ncbi:MAG TPA: hypothetical protein VFI65_26400 [Streptosporangiaceae bacterium]|nr:hypothetical protein [Streptosporangiaceae bacterium]
MSIDEGELRASLSTALDELDYGPLPLDSVIGKGKTVVVRRRMTAVAGALAIAVAAVAGPVIAHQIGRSAQSTASASSVKNYHVTVHSPGPNSPAGLVAYGLLNHRRWQITGAVGKPGDDEFCFKALGESGQLCQSQKVPAPTGKGTPGDFELSEGGIPMALVGSVRADVRYVRVSLNNGQTLKLRPVAIFGSAHAAWVALEVPYPAAVTRITAYSAKGEVGYALPFGHGTLFSEVRWIAPGQPPSPSRATYKVASGKVHGKRWAEYAYVGPWGTCFAGSGVGGECFALALSHLGGVSQSIGPNAAYDLLFDDPVVSYVIVHRAHAAPLRVPAFSLHGVNIFGFAVTPSHATVHWDGYSASGHLLDQGSVGYHSESQP